MTITASLVKELREATGAGMMDCKNALKASNGDVALATEELRKKGLAAAAKKSGRVVAEGLVAVAVSGKKGAVVEVNAETDFVARNEIFQNFVKETADIAVNENGDTLLNAVMQNGKTIQDTLIDNISVIGENQSFRRADTISVEHGVVASYVHGALVDGLGKIGVLIGLETGVALTTEEQTHTLEALGKQLAMHIAAAKPQFNTSADIDPEVIEKERKFLTEQALEEGTPEKFVHNKIEGRLNKFKKEIVLAEQIFVVDGSSKVQEVVEQVSKDLGVDVKIKSFVSFILGDGIEKKEENFAEEVAKTMNG